MRFLKVFTLPIMIVLVGASLYYFTFYFIHEYSKTPKVMTDEKTDKIEEKSHILVEKEPEPIDKIIKEAQQEEIKVDENLSDEIATEVVEDINTTDTILLEPTESVEITETVIEEIKKPYVGCYIVDTESLNVRSEPTIDALILGRVSLKDIVCAYEIKFGWINSDVGWIYANKLLPVELSYQDKAITKLK